MQVFFLRHMASIARSRNAYELMQSVVRVCKDKGIDMGSVLVPAAGNDDTDSTSHPFEILSIVSATTGYSQARTISPSGRNAFFNNAAFEHAILSLDACNRAYERNEVEVVSLFIHADDVAYMKQQMAKSWRVACSKSGVLSSVSSNCNHVRVYLRRLGTYVECEPKFHVIVNRESGLVSAALELLPRELTSLCLEVQEDGPDVQADGMLNSAQQPAPPKQPPLQGRDSEVTGAALPLPDLALGAFGGSAGASELLDAVDMDELISSLDNGDASALDGLFGSSPLGSPFGLRSAGHRGSME